MSLHSNFSRKLIDTNLKSPLLVSRELQTIFKDLAKSLQNINDDAPKVEQLIAKLNPEVALALTEYRNDSALMRRNDYFLTLWAQSGWFASAWETPLELISKTALKLGTSSHRLAESAIAAHFEREAPKFIDYSTKTHPQREKIIRAAYDAHKEGHYALSIPVFLIQADGIGSGHFEVQSIYTRSNFPEIKKKIKDSKGAESLRSLQFLVGSLNPINASRGQRKLYGQNLNRHAVLHGESVDYPTKENSLKSISWLNFISELVSPLL